MIKELNVDELKKALDKKTKLSIIDVRKDEELQYGTISGYTHIPMDQIEKRFKELNKKEEHIVYCRTGGRSSIVCEFLAKKGYKVKNLTGGILAWQKHDPSIQLY